MAMHPPPPVPTDPATDRSAQRAQPRLGVALAAAGCALAVLGVLTIAGDLLVGDTSDFDGGGGTNQVPGIALTALVMAVGYLLVVRFPNSPLGTAGVVASALAAPALVFFLTFSESDFPPFSTDAILGLSAILWLGSYAVGPGRGHPFYLGAGLIAVWLFVLEIVEGVFTFPFDAIGGFAVGFDPGFDGGFGGDPFDPSPDVPSVETLGVLTLLFAIGYVVAAHRLDRSGRSGLATPFAFAALVTFPVGILFMADSLGNVMTGVAFIALGIGYGYGGATTGRRLTTWLGGYYVAQGAAVVVGEVVGDNPSATTVGAALILAGGLIVLAAHVVHARLGEPSETTPGPSRFSTTGPVPVAATLTAFPTTGPPTEPPPTPTAGHEHNPPPPVPPPGTPGGPPPGSF